MTELDILNTAVNNGVAKKSGSWFQFNEQKIGQIVTASWSKDKKVEFLAVLQIEKAEKETLHIGSSTGPTAQLFDLPYLLEENKKEEKE